MGFIGHDFSRIEAHSRRKECGETDIHLRKSTACQKVRRVGLRLRGNSVYLPVATAASSHTKSSPRPPAADRRRPSLSQYLASNHQRPTSPVQRSAATKSQWVIWHFSMLLNQTKIKHQLLMNTQDVFQINCCRLEIMGNQKLQLY